MLIRLSKNRSLIFATRRTSTVLPTLQLPHDWC